jgi:peptide deformylase
MAHAPDHASERPAILDKVRPAELPRSPLILNHRGFHWITDKVCGIVEEPTPLCVANPEIVWASEEKNIYQEGCLSIPEYYEDVERPEKVRMRYLDRDGKTQEIDADGLLATCLQHEIDHLNGVLFIDHLSRLKRERVQKKFVKAARLRSDE